MVTKKYRFLLLITILFSLIPPCVGLTDHDKKVINKLAKDTLLIYALSQGLPRANHLKSITGLLFGNSNIALEILTKKIMRHVCKQLYLQGMPILALHAAALKRFEKYQRPSQTKHTITKHKSKDNPKVGFLSNLSKFAIITVAFLMVFIAMGALLSEKEEHRKQRKDLVSVVDEHLPPLEKKIATTSAEIALLRANDTLREITTRTIERKISILENLVKTIQEELARLKK